VNCKRCGNPWVGDSGSSDRISDNICGRCHQGYSFSAIGEIANLKALNDELVKALKECTEEMVKYGFATVDSPIVVQNRQAIEKAMEKNEDA